MDEPRNPPSTRFRPRTEDFFARYQIARLDLVRSVTFSALFDLCSWLAGARQPVPERTLEYGFSELRYMPDPRRRLGRYCSRGLLGMWDTVLEPFFATGFRMAPELGNSAQLRGEGIDRGAHRIRVELRAISRSRLVSVRMSRPLQPSEWSLTFMVLVKGAFVYIDELLVRPVEPETVRSTGTGRPEPGPSRSEPAAVINPFALLSAVPANGPAGDLPPPLPILPNPLVHTADSTSERPRTGEDDKITATDADGQDAQERTLREAAGRRDVDAAYLLAESLLARGLPEQAHLWYRTAADTVYARALFNLAVVLESRGRPDDAAALYRQAGQVGHVPAIKNLVTLLRDQGDTGEAEQWSRRVAQDRRNRILPSQPRSVHENAGSRAASPAINGIPVDIGWSGQVFEVGGWSDGVFNGGA